MTIYSIRLTPEAAERFQREALMVKPVEPLQALLWAATDQGILKSSSQYSEVKPDSDSTIDIIV